MTNIVQSCTASSVPLRRLSPPTAATSVARPAPSRITLPRGTPEYLVSQALYMVFRSAAL
ncbi:hypothetical protein [Microbispora sitophila]|uniref:hypothetical protein n=1 Tax=Microbispora sitophila TaxID=2771537 RepID=UPI001D032B7F|nr:hypothetical protein [Microbispora sitophila]